MTEHIPHHSQALDRDGAAPPCGKLGLSPDPVKVYTEQLTERPSGRRHSQWSEGQAGHTEAQVLVTQVSTQALGAMRSTGCTEDFLEGFERTVKVLAPNIKLKIRKHFYYWPRQISK